MDREDVATRHHFFERIWRIDRAPGFDSVQPGTDEMPPEMTADQAVRVIKAMGKHIVDEREPRPGALDIVDAVALAVDALRRAEALRTMREPDPETGLMPCGCGSSELMGLLWPIGPDEIMYYICCRECQTQTGLSENKESEVKRWNRAMGWREEE